MTQPASSALHRWAPPLLILSGLGMIGAGASVEYLLPGTQTLAQFGLSGTLFGLAAKLGGALFFGGLFALAAAAAPAPPAKLAPASDHAPDMTAAAVRAARIVRQRRDGASA
jgi:hypothetical protein